MARSKKKKWKSRIKKALKLAAIGGAGYLAAKRFGGKKGIGTTETISDAQKAHNFAADAPVTGVIKPTAPVAKKQIIPMGAGYSGELSKKSNF